MLMFLEVPSLISSLGSSLRDLGYEPKLIGSFLGSWKRAEGLAMVLFAGMFSIKSSKGSALCSMPLLTSIFVL